MLKRWRITALVLLAGLLASPVLALTSGDACCEGSLPCASASAPCTSMGAIPCCPAEGGAADAAATGSSGAPAVCSPEIWRPLRADPASAGQHPGSPPGPAEVSSLRYSVVLRI